MHGTTMCHILESLLMAGASMTDKAESGSADRDPTFPGEDPTQPELDAWIKIMSDRLKKTEYFYLTRNEVPPSLIPMSEALDLSILVEQAPVSGLRARPLNRLAAACNGT